ncbi:MAG: hypothetical protein M1840_007272 [Geoglossum simile]|nr:MAG: hypothetical protein M1840_007272 [Geoglossum simile]
MAAWTSVWHWLARDGNCGWCLVVDGLNDESDTERMRKLLPSCAYGHIIATSRVTVPGYKFIEIPILDRDSRLKLLLNDQVETKMSGGTKINKIQHAAEQIANLLGYLPLALAQAAAFVKKRALSLVDYLRRLEQDLARYVSSPFPPYKAGVFSCWEMSARALMESTPHAVDLLRICSFLSPDGISRELLCRGLEAMDWFQNEESRLDDALDNLVMYALVKRKHSNAVKGDIFSIHPLIQRLVRETDIEGNSVVLVTKSEQRERLRRAAELKAISLVGCGLKTTYDNREACEWAFERRNMGHISLCLEKYLPECDRELLDGVADKKLAKALTNFAGLKFYWGEYSDSQRMVKRSIEIYERTLPGGGDPNLEAELLMAKQQLLGIWIGRHVNRNMREVGRLVDETLSRQSAILQPDDVHLLWTQSMNASHFAHSERKREAVKLFRECMEKNQKALQPGDPVNMATINNYALLCCDLGMEEEATQLHEKSKKLYLQHRGANHQDTHIVLKNIASFKANRGDDEGALECYKIVAEGSESTYGLANRDTLEALRILAHQHRRSGCKEEAVQVERKIAKGRKILEDASKLAASLDEEDDSEEE